MRSFAFLLLLGFALAVVEYTDSEVAVAVGGGISLKGYLVMPKSGQAQLGLIFLHAWGTSDANMTIEVQMPNGSVATPQVFKDIAYYLGEAGVASLRYEKRTDWCEHNYEACVQKGLQYPTVRDFEDDAVAAAAFLKTKLAAVTDAHFGAIAYDQGCDYLPNVVARVPGMTHGVLLGGSGIPVSQTSDNNLRRSVEYYTSLVAYLTAKGKTDEAQMAQQKLDAAQLKRTNCTKFFQEIAATGHYSTPCDPWTPSADIESQSWYGYTTPTARFASLHDAALAQEGKLRLMTLNSDDDWSAPPTAYEPLQEMLGTMQSQLQLTALLISLDGMNHDLMETDYHRGPSISHLALAEMEDFLCIEVVKGDVANPTHQLLCQKHAVSIAAAAGNGVAVASLIFALIAVAVGAVALILALILFMRSRKQYASLASADYTAAPQAN